MSVCVCIKAVIKPFTYSTLYKVLKYRIEQWLSDDKLPLTKIKERETQRSS